MRMSLTPQRWAPWEESAVAGRRTATNIRADRRLSLLRQSFCAGGICPHNSHYVGMRSRYIHGSALRAMHPQYGTEILRVNKWA